LDIFVVHRSFILGGFCGLWGLCGLCGLRVKHFSSTFAFSVSMMKPAFYQLENINKGFIPFFFVSFVFLYV